MATQFFINCKRLEKSCREHFNLNYYSDKPSFIFTFYSVLFSSSSFKFWEYRERNLWRTWFPPLAIMSFASPSQGQGTSPKEMKSGDRCVNLWTPTSCVFLAPTSVINGRVFLRIEKLLPSIVQSTYRCSSSSGEACTELSHM